jgi:hypothetical protein
MYKFLDIAKLRRDNHKRNWVVSETEIALGYLSLRSGNLKKELLWVQQGLQANKDATIKITNKMQLYRLICYSKSALHVSGDVFSHHQKHLTVFTISGSIHPICCRLVFWMSWNCFAVSTHPRHQPAANWVNTTRNCKYSHVLLMMGKNIALNLE